MATAPTIGMGEASPEVLQQPTDPAVPSGYYRRSVGMALEPIPPAGAPEGTPPCGPLDGPFVAGTIPNGSNIPLTAEQAAYLTAKYPEAA